MKNKLSIFFVTQIDPIYMISFFDEFFRILELKKFDLNLKIFNIPNFNESKFSLFKRLFKFYGFLDFFILLMMYLKEIFISRRIINFKNYLKICNIKFQNISSVNSKEFKDSLETKNPDIVVSLSAPEIFKETILNTSKIEFINIHCAPLPSYKGMMPNFWQKINNEIYSAITIHRISSKIDSGEILYQRKIDLFQTDSLHNAIIKGKKLSAIVLLEYLFKDGLNKNPLPQESYYSFPRKNDVLLFKKHKKKFF